MPVIYFDIETIPTQNQELAEEALIKAQKRQLEEPLTVHQADDIYRGTALRPVVGEIVSIAYAIDDEPVASVTRPDLTPDAERMLLRQFWHRLAQYRRLHWVGYNIANFDIPFLFTRSIVHGLKPSVQFPPDTAPWKGEITDLMQTLNGFRGRNSASFHEACLALGVPTPKTDIDGSGVWDAVQAGEYERVAKYCRRDVEATRLLHYRATFRAEPETEQEAV